VTRRSNYSKDAADGEQADYGRQFRNGSRDRCRGIVPLADRASGVQAVDDRVAPTLLLRLVGFLRRDIVGTFGERPELVYSCLSGG